MKFSTKGDQGETSLLGGQRIPKYDLRPETYGTLDEASSALGIAKAQTDSPRITEAITISQEAMLVIGAELSALPEDYEKLKRKITDEDVKKLEDIIDDLQRDVEIPRVFILPGKTIVSAHIDLARTIVRRAERRAAKLKSKGLITNEIINKYLNRLADMLFTLARFEIAKAHFGRGH
ncbi:MAG: cob(I)yrinic acid a,c-diamide adenosyltransferase [Candidatus Babeliaceae bacterium]|nr:cob(I)yrinic acid a,c-diamide adenosyltransferase [Candidatus Babeliaceae bacterium]